MPNHLAHSNSKGAKLPVKLKWPFRTKDKCPTALTCMDPQCHPVADRGSHSGAPLSSRVWFQAVLPVHGAGNLPHSESLRFEKRQCIEYKLGWRGVGAKAWMSYLWLPKRVQAACRIFQSANMQVPFFHKINDKTKTQHQRKKIITIPRCLGSTPKHLPLMDK